jgi:succinate dehydrogenase/fumarate reductase flavoprotein subunit
MITSWPTWHKVVDVVVVGTGGGAMTAATVAADDGAEVVVVEKDRVVGGTTGVSGGVMWIPMNHHMAEAGLGDSRDEALRYIRRLADGREPDPSLVELFVDTAPEMLAYLNAKTPLRTQMVEGFPDYYAGFDIFGAKPAGGRAVEPQPFPVRDALPEWTDRLATRSTLMSLGATTTLSEDMDSMRRGVAPGGPEASHRQVEDVRVKGAALVAALLKGLVDRGVEVLTATPARELVMVDGEVVGVRCERPTGSSERDGEDLLLGARKGVVLACGGFEWNAEMVRAFIGYDVQPVSPPNNTGDGHVMGMEAGAKLGNMTSYWGTGAMFDPLIVRDGALVPQFDAGRQVPGVIVVNRLGARFVNESVTYHDFPKAFGAFDPNLPGFPNTPPAWLIFDEAAKEMAPIGVVAAGESVPEWVAQASSPRALAERIGIDPDGFEATVTSFNEQAAGGHDPDFRRPGVRPLNIDRIYALEIHPGTLGTNGGLRVDADARVLSHRGGVVPGLYAAGNTSAAIFGGAYPSGGAPIAAGATFGYLAGRHAAATAARALAPDTNRSFDETTLSHLP